MGQIWFPFETMYIFSEFVSATMPSNQIALESLNYVYERVRSFPNCWSSCQMEVLFLVNFAQCLSTLG